MKALVFLADFTSDPEPWEPPLGAGERTQRLATTPMALLYVDDPPLRGDDWAVLDTRMCGICGSDAKQVFMDDAEESGDNAMTAFISFPQVLGHEVVGTVAESGPAAGVTVGDRVVLNPWLSCGPRGFAEPCPACSAGDYNLCHRFCAGALTPGIHTGNSSDATGGFAERLPAHGSMCIPVPDDIPDEVAVLADPFSVSLHAVTRHPPPPGANVVVYGAGALGTTTVAVLRALHPAVRIAVVAAHPAQAALAKELGADIVMDPWPEAELVEALASWSGGELHRPWEGLPVAMPGGIATIYDTVGSATTLEVGVRVLAARGELVVTGVAAPERFEWTPLYFKEIRLAGPNAFGVEQVEGQRQHAMAHYFDLVRAGRVDVSAMLTHTFPLEKWRDAFVTLGEQHETGAIKVAFDLR